MVSWTVVSGLAAIGCNTSSIPSPSWHDSQLIYRYSNVNLHKFERICGLQKCNMTTFLFCQLGWTFSPSSSGYTLIQRNITHCEILIYITCQRHTNWENSCCSKNTNCRPRFWHAHFPYFIYGVSRRYQARAGYLSLFLWWHLFFLEHHFYWSKTFECVSYESSVATSTTTPASPCYKYKRMTSTPHSLSHSGETALLANFHRGPHPSPELYSSPVSKRSKLFCFTSWIIREIYMEKKNKSTLPYHRVVTL